MDFSIVSKNLNKVSFTISKHSPEILVISGIVGLIGTTVLACKATTKANDILNEHKVQVEQVHQVFDSEQFKDEYDEKDMKKDLTIVYSNTIKNFAKLYGPAVICGIVSIASILAGTNILHKRNVALAAAYATLDNGFKAYRKRVVEKFGEEVDKELRYGMTTQKITEVEKDANGKEKKVKKDISVSDYDGYSDYARFFDEASPYWEDESEMNLTFLRAQQNFMNEKLLAQGHVYLNEVYDALGIPRSKAGQIVGWVYNPENPVGDNYIDFGIYQTNRAVARDFVNGYEKVILLDFNVDGNILDLM